MLDARNGFLSIPHVPFSIIFQRSCLHKIYSENKWEMERGNGSNDSLGDNT
jgi:hypothetical protein